MNADLNPTGTMRSHFPSVLRPMSFNGIWARMALLLVALSWVRPVSAQAPLASLEYRVVGTQLRVTPALVSVPKGIAGSLRADLVRGDGTPEPADAALAANAYVEGILRGPSFPARRLVARPGDPLMLPPLPVVGEYRVDGLRLVDAATGATRLDGSPASVPVQVFEEVLVSRVTTRPLSMQEISDRGIVIDGNNFRAVEFEVGFVLDGRTIPVKFPVVAPDFRQSRDIIPNAELQKRLATAQQINEELSRQIVEEGGLPPELARPGLNLQVKGINFEKVGDSNPVNLRLPIPPIPALMIIPGNIGYLNQFFSVQIFTENGAPGGSGLSVFNVQAKLSLPPGPDGIRSTNYAAPGDDPLRMARVGPQADIRDVLPLSGPAPERLNRFQPGQQGSAEFLVEGLQEGLHLLDLDLTADLDGLAAGTVKVQGKAAGSVLVRNPKFSLAFSHPRTVRTGEPYTAYVTVLNTSEVPANQLSITLRGASLSGGVLESPEVVLLGDVAPGQTVTAAFRVRAQRTGFVRFSNLTTGENSVQGRFNLSMGVDERGVELSPDALAMPVYVDRLPTNLVAAANRVLGQALGAATAPLLPAGVRPVSRSTITRRLLELAEAGQRLALGDPSHRVLSDLLLDWQGGRIGSVFGQTALVRASVGVGTTSVVPPDPGFDQILRSTDAGREFREALWSLIEASDSRDASQRLADRAADFAGRSEAWWLAASGSSDVTVEAETDAGLATALTSTLDDTAGYTGARGSWIAGRTAATRLFRFRVLRPVSGAEVSVVQLGTNGLGTRWTWNLGAAPADVCFTFDPADPSARLLRDEQCDGLPESDLLATVSPVQELPPEILMVRQDTEVNLARPQFRCTGGPANNYGNVVGVLFSKPMLQTNVNVPAAFRLDSGTAGAGVQVQPGGRVALVSLQEGISAIRPRQLTVTGVKDLRGQLVTAVPRPIETTFADGVALNGRVLRADGSAAIGVPVTVTYYDPWKDPFDRCDPIIITHIAQKYTDTNGAFTFDFVHGSVGFTVSAVDTGGLTVEAVRAILDATEGDHFAEERLVARMGVTNTLAALGVESVAEAASLVEGLDRAVWSDSIPLTSARIGKEHTIALRFRGRGVVSGRVVEANGSTPVPNAAVNLYPDPDSRELVRGVLTGTDGRFEFRGVPLGLYTVQVKSPFGHFRSVSGNLPRVRETNELEVVLTPPEQREIVRTMVAGRVVEPDTQDGHARAKVFLRHLEFGLVAAVTADQDGYWSADDVPTGLYQVEAYSQDSRRKANARGEAVFGRTAFITAVLNGTGVVVGRVENSTGRPVARALVAGGETLVRTDAEGRFRLTGVPLGSQSISAGLEGADAPGGFPRLGSAGVTVLPGVDNFVVVRLRAAGAVTGRVLNANGVPQPRIKVAIPIRDEGFAWVEANDDGEFEFPGMAPGEYIVSAPSPPVTEDTESLIDEALGRTDEEVLAAVGRAADSIRTVIQRRYGDAPLVPSGDFGFTRVVVRADGDVAQADIQFLPTGVVDGRVLNDQGVPIGARVRLTGLGLNERGEPATRILGDRDSDAASGVFRFSNLPQGPWAVQAASPFYPTVLLTNGVTRRDELTISNLVLQFPPRRATHGRLVGTVVNPDGSPVGAGARVRINFSDDYEIQTDTNGVFDTQVQIPARTYQVTVLDPASGLRGQIVANVQAGLTNAVTVPLLGLGDLTLTVRLASGLPATNALVQVQQGGFPSDRYSGQTDATGVFTLRNVVSGRYGISVAYLGGATRLEGRTSIDVVAGSEGLGTLTLGPTGSLRGFMRDRSGAPIPFARVSVGRVAYPVTDERGYFEVTGLGLGTYAISGREPVSGRLALTTAVLSREGQIVEVSLVELPQGELSGTVFQQDEPGPIAGAEVTLFPNDGGLTPVRTVTTGPDGRYRFVGVMPGAYRLNVNKVYPVREVYSLSVAGEFPADGSNRTQDLTLPPREVRGRILVRVLEPGGSGPAVSAMVNDRSTGPDGTVVFDGLPARTHRFVARSTVPGQTSSAAVGSGTLTRLETNAVVTLTLSGTGTVRGTVVRHGGGDPVPGAEVQVMADNRELGVSLRSTALADDQGQFQFGNLPLGTFRVTAVDGALTGTASGTIAAGGQTETVEVSLGASGSVVGRLVRADGTNTVPQVPVRLTFRAPSGLDGVAEAVTDAEGRFELQAIPEGEVTLVAVVDAVDGLARRRAMLSGNGTTLDLGDVALDEAWPEVVEMVPAPGATGVGTASAVEVVFSEPMATNSIEASGIYLRGPTNRVAADLTWFGLTNGGALRVRLSPRTPLASLTTYRVVVLNGVVEDGLGGVLGRGPVDRVDRPLLGAFTASFNTRDDDAPRLLSLFPTNTAVQVDPRAVLRAAFDEPIQDQGIAMTLTGPSGPVPGVTAVGLNGLVLTFTPAAPLSLNTRYELRFDGVRDLAGNPLADQPRVIHFNTLDTLGPELSELRLADGRAPVGGSRVDLEAVLAVPEPGVSVRFTVNGAPAGVVSSAPFRLPYLLPAGGKLTVRALATDAFGNEGPFIERTLNITANEPPGVTLLRGAPGNAPVLTGGSFAFTVGASDDVGVTNLTVTVTGPTNAVRVLPTGTSTAFTFAVPSDATAGGRVEVRARATDALGAVSTESSIGWDVADGTRPSVVLVSPAPLAVLNLDEPLDLRLRLGDNSGRLGIRVVATGGLVQTNIFELTGTPGDYGTNGFSIPLTAAIRTGGDLLLAVAVSDDAGNAVTNEFRYRLPDVAPPRLVSVQPTNGATRLSLWTSLRDLNFSESLRASTVNTNGIQTTNQLGQVVPVTVQNFGTLVRLVLPAPLEPGVEYVNVLRGLTDDAGNPIASADGEARPEGTNLTFTTAAILSVTPVSGTPVKGGETVPVTVRFEPELGARHFRFSLNDGPASEVSVPSGGSEVQSTIRIPLDTPDLVVRIQASPDTSFTRPYSLPPVALRFDGNLATNQPPVLQLTRVSPPSGPVALGSVFSVSVSATDDFGITQMTLAASGSVVTNLTYPNGAARTLTFSVATNAAPEVPVRLVATATDTQGVVNTRELEIPLLALRYPFASGTLFYSRGPASQGSIWALDPDGHFEVQITSGSLPQISPDGRYLAFTRGPSTDYFRNDLYVRDLATGEEVRVVQESGQSIHGFDWMANSEELVFDFGSWMDRVGRTGAPRSRFSTVHGWDDAPSVNRIDGRVAFHNTVGNPVSGLYLLDPDGTNRRRIPNSVHPDAYPVWSPDGEWLAFLNNGNLVRMRPDGFDRTPLTALSRAGDGFSPVPSWSLDGSRLFVVGTVGGTNGFWTVDAMTGEIRLLRAESGVNYAQLGRGLVPAIAGELPRLVSSIPAAGSSGASLWTAESWLVFNRALSSASVTNGGMGFSLPGAVVAPVGSRVRLTLPLPLPPGTTVTNTVLEGVTDLAGRPVPATNTVFTTARILDVSPAEGTPVLGGQFVDVSVGFEAGLGAGYFRFRLNDGDPVEVAVPAGATRVSAPLLVPLNAGDPVIEIAASDDAAFSRPYLLPARTLRFEGNSGTNRPPVVTLTPVHPLNGEVRPGQSVSLQAVATSDFGIDRLRVTLSGAIEAERDYAEGGPLALTFTVPADAIPGTAVTIQAEATDALGMVRTAAPLVWTVVPAPEPVSVGTLFYSRGTGPGAEVWAIHADGTGDRRVTVGLHPRLSPDHRQLLVGRDKDNANQKNVYLVDLVTGEERSLFNHSDFVIFYDWRRDSSEVLFDYGCALWSIRPEDPRVRQVATGNCFDDAPAVNPQDGRLAWHNDRTGFGLVVAASDFSNRQVVPQTLPGDYWAQWSPDGEWLSFVRQTNVFKIRPDGTDLTLLARVTVGTMGEGPAVWTPSGDAVVFAATIQGTNGLFVVSADGAGVPVRLPTVDGPEIRFAGSVALPVVPRSTTAELVAVQPSNGAVRQPLWPGVVEFQLSEPVDPGSATPALFDWTGPAGAVAFAVETLDARVRLVPADRLEPGSDYRVRLLPGLRTADGRPFNLEGGVPVPTAGSERIFSTAQVLALTPTNGFPVVAGQSVSVTVELESTLGATHARFRINNGPAVVRPLTLNATEVTAQVSVPIDATSATLMVELADTPGFERPLLAGSRTLALTSLGGDLVLDAPDLIELTAGTGTNVVVTARSTQAAVVALGLDWVGPVPPWMAVAPTQFTNQPASGSAGFPLWIDSTFVVPGDYTVPLVARSAADSVRQRAITVRVLENPLLAVTRWKDPVSGNWNDATKWTAGVPAPGLPAVVDVPGTYSVTLTADAAVDQLSFGAASGIQILSFTNRALTVNRAAQFGTNTVVRMAGAVRGPGWINLAGRLEWTAGSFESGGPVQLLPGATGVVSTAADRGLYRVLRNGGTIDWTGGRVFQNGFGVQGHFENLESGTVLLTGDGRWQDGRFENRGTVVKPGDRKNPDQFFTSFNSAFTSSGTVRIESGGLDLPRTSRISGVLEVAEGTRVYFGSGNHVLEATSVVRGAGEVQASSGLVESSGAWTLEGLTDIRGTLRFLQTSNVTVRQMRLAGDLDGPANLTISHRFDWVSGRMLAGGSLTLAPGGLHQISGPSDRSQFRVLNVEGTLVWSGGRIFQNGTGGQGIVHVGPGGVLELAGDSSIHDGAVHNQGLIVKTAGSSNPDTVVSGFVTRLLQNGIFRIQAGGVELSRSSQSTGSFELSAGTVLHLSGSRLRFDPGSRISGAGRLRVNSGTTEILGGLGPLGGVEVSSALMVESSTPVVLESLVLTGTLGGRGEIAVTRDFEWRGGRIEGSGTFRLDPSGTARWTGGDRSLARRWDNRGTVLWLAGRTFSADGAFLNRPGAHVEIHGDLSGFDGVWRNEGVVEKVSGTGIASLSGRVDNAGEIRVQQGALSLRGGGSHGGAFNVASGAELIFGGGFHWAGPGTTAAGAGTVATESSPTVRFGEGTRLATHLRVTSGSLTLQPGAVLDSAGRRVLVDGTASFNTGRLLPVSRLEVGGNLGGTDPFESPSVRWYGGEMAGPGTVTVLAGGTLDMANGRTLSTTLINRGVAVWTTGTWFNRSTALFRNEPGASLELRGDAAFSQGRIDNRGSIVKTAGVGNSDVSGRVDQNGLVRIETGTLALNGGGNSGGDFEVRDGARLQWGGSHTFADTTRVRGAGRLTQSGTTDFEGTLDVAGPIAVGGTFRVLPGAVAELAGRELTVSGRLDLDAGRPQSIGILNLTGSLAGTDPVAVTESLSWRGGEVMAGMSLRVLPDASLELAGTDRTLGGLVTLEGQGVWTAGRTFARATGIFRIAPGAGLDLQLDASQFNGRFENEGLFRKSSGTGIALVTAVLVNRGTLAVDQGTLQLSAEGTNSGALQVAAGATFHVTQNTLTLEPGTTVTGPGTLRWSGSARLALGTDVDFGTAQVLFEGNSTVTGNFTMANQPGGLISVDHSLTIPGSVTVGGTFAVRGASTTVTISRTFTLLETGRLENEGSLRVGEFIQLDGGEVIGPAPIEIGLPLNGVAPVIRELRFGGARVGPASASAGEPSVVAAIEVLWEGQEHGEFSVESSADLRSWTEEAVSIESLGNGQFRAVISGKAVPSRFIRVRDRW